MDDSTDVVGAIEEFTKLIKDDAVSALDGCVDKEKTEIYFFDQSLHCVCYFLKDLFGIRMKKK